MSKLPFDTYMEVVWDDAVSNDGWVTVATEDSDPERVVTRGWLIKKTESYIMLAGSIYEAHGNTVGSTQTIPTGMIVSSRELKVTNVRSKSQRRLHSKPNAEEIHREPSKG